MLEFIFTGMIVYIEIRRSQISAQNLLEIRLIFLRGFKKIKIFYVPSAGGNSVIIDVYEYVRSVKSVRSPAGIL